MKACLIYPPCSCLCSCTVVHILHKIPFSSQHLPAPGSAGIVSSPPAQANPQASAQDVPLEQQNGKWPGGIGWAHLFLAALKLFVDMPLWPGCDI